MPNRTGAQSQPQSSKTRQLYRPPNNELRDREYLTPAEVDRLLVAAKKLGRHGHRNYTFILMSYRHGLRVTEAVNLKWANVDYSGSCLHIHRLKQGKRGIRSNGTETYAKPKFAGKRVSQSPGEQLKP